MRLPRRPSFAVASLVATTLCALILFDAAVAQSAPRQRFTATGRVAIQVDINGLFATVLADGTLKPASNTVGAAEQFEVYDLGTGLFALKSVANGRFLGAEASHPIVANRGSIGEAAAFRRLGGERMAVRLRAVGAKAVVCAAEAGAGALVASRRCPHALELLRVENVRVQPPPSFALTSPVPGSILQATSVTFTWDSPGDDAWINVGTMPGASDIYASGSLGQVTAHTATGLPLNGSTLFVQVGRRVGTLVERANAEYVASVRKGVAVITDFADRRLEDWTGSGMTQVADLSAQLRSMESHWAWLSRGLETYRWDIVRIQLSQPAVENAYDGWVAFRDAAVTLARQQIRTADYDVNSDGVIDAMWLIVSSGDKPVPFAIGGASRNAGANLFVDGQASGSVIARATGNFNHELAHCLGLPDMYGTYSTMNKLTFMNDSWALPPQDFSAYERVTLGWVHPQVVTATTRRVELPTAADHLAAVMVPTGHAAEYFLIEYRDRPEVGYGSAAPDDYKGLAVYHVWDGSSMWQDPPIVKLEPADGEIQPNQPLDPDDFAYPENPRLLRPMIVRSYDGDGDEVFRITNVTWGGDGLLFDIVVAPPRTDEAPTNLLTNPSFEVGGTDGPSGWSTGSFVPNDASFVWPSAAVSNGNVSAALESVSGNDLWWSQTVALVEGEHYRLCGALKGEAIQGVQGDVGANISVLGGFIRSDAISGSFDWTTRCVDFVAGAPQAEVACRLGFYGSTARGKLWCDALTLEHAHMRSAF